MPLRLTLEEAKAEWEKRNEMGITWAALARATKVHYSTMVRLKDGDVDAVSLEKLNEILKFLGVEVSDIMARYDTVEIEVLSLDDIDFSADTWVEGNMDVNERVTVLLAALSRNDKKRDRLIAELDAVGRTRETIMGDIRDTLIIQMKRSDNAVALSAVDRLRHYSWLQDGALKDADLSEACLTGASLWFANLEGADLTAAHLDGAILQAAHLEGTILLSANLEGANLRFAHLEGANLMGAYLEGAILDGALFDEKTVLPDAEYLGGDGEISPRYDKYWTSGTDMSRYTDPAHADFWVPD